MSLCRADDRSLHELAPGVYFRGAAQRMSAAHWQITNATLVSPDRVEKASGALVSDGRISRLLGPGEEEAGLLNINLHGLALSAAFINAHDSLLATYLPFNGAGRPYLNWLAFDNELKSSPLFKERMLLDVADLYALGAYRNLLNGATTVVDHIPAFVRAPFVERLPVSLLGDFGISHSICSYSLGWGEGPRREHERATRDNLPYITHIAEGTDPESRQSLARLEDFGALSDRTVLLQGIGLSETDLDRIALAGASLVWAPASNLHLYGRTLAAEKALDRGIAVLLGSDAAMYGSPGLLADLRAAAAYFQNTAGRALDGRMLLDMITREAARALRLDDRGSIAPGLRADLAAWRGKYPNDPYRSLVELEPHEIYLVVRDGMPVYGEESLERAFTSLGLLFDRITVRGTRKIVLKGLKEVLERAEKTLGRRPEFSFLPADSW